MAPARSHLPPLTIASRARHALVLLYAVVVAAVVALALSSAGHAPAVLPPAFEASKGAHVTVSALPGVDLRPVMRLPGISASSGPFPSFVTGARHGRREADLRLEARPTRWSAVDRPLHVSGTWARSGSVVLEGGLARALRAQPGDRIAVSSIRGAVPLRVAGTASTPGGSQAIGYVTAPTLGRIAPNDRTYGSTLYLRVENRAVSGRYADWVKRAYPAPQATVSDWHRLVPLGADPR